MTVASWLALLVPALVTYLTVRRLSRGRDRTLTRAVAAAIAPGLGLGFASCWYFFLLLVTRTRTQALAGDASLWLAASATLAVLYWRDRPATRPPHRSGDPQTRSIRAVPIETVIAAAGAVGVAVLAGSAIWLHHRAVPHGEWDAWAIWNLRARALLFRPADWTAILSQEIGWSNPDYPLLVPLSVARLWDWSGDAGTIVPGIVAMTFVASTAAGIVTLIGSARGWAAGLLSGAVLLVSRTYVFQGSSQCADVPLAFYMSLAVACVVVSRQLREGDGWILLAIAGAAGGLAAWTKNEGAVLLVAIAVFVCTWRKESRSKAWLSFAGGAAVPLAAWLWFKLFLSPPNDQLIPVAREGLTARFMDASRWSIIVDRLPAMVLDWGGVPGGALLILAIAVALTYGADRRSIVRGAYALGLVAAMMAGYVLAYAITWKPLTWHIDTSFHRLMAQVWPTLVWAGFQLSGRQTAPDSVPDLKVYAVIAARFVKTHLTWILGMACMLVVVLTRTWGLHIDELGYFHLAISEPLGDALGSGKPVAFYVLNYALYHAFRWPAGWLHPLILPVCYAVATVLALWYLAARAVDAGAARASTFAVLLLSPFVLFNASQLMMETAQLPLLSVTLALLLSVCAGGHTRQRTLWLVAAAAGSVLIKETALPALLILMLAFFPALGLRVWPLVAGAAIGSLANALLLRAIHAPLPPTHYGGMAQLWTSLSAGQPWARTSAYLGVWGFFVGLAWLGALAVAARRRDAMSWTLVAAGALSAGGVFLVQLATDPILPFPRYAYPVMWAGLACCGIACARSRTGWVSAAVVVLQLPIAGGLWPGTFRMIEHWPTLITLESYNNSATILSGTPAYGWIATSPRALDDLCVYLPRANAAGAAHTEQWFRDVARQVRFFEERSYRDFLSCDAPKAIVDRRFDLTACEEEACSPSQYTIRSCLDQNVLYFSNRIGPTKSRVCLP